MHYVPGRSITTLRHCFIVVQKVIDHYENPRNVGALDKNDANVGTGLVGAPACGDVMKLQVSLMNVYTLWRLVLLVRYEGLRLALNT